MVGTKTVEREPLLVWLLTLSMVIMVRMVRIGPAGEQVMDTESGISATGLLTASLRITY